MLGGETNAYSGGIEFASFHLVIEDERPKDLVLGTEANRVAILT